VKFLTFAFVMVGAGLTNMMFMPKGSVVITTAPSKIIGITRIIYGNYAFASGHHFYIVPPIDYDGNPWAGVKEAYAYEDHNVNIEIDIGKFTDVFDQAVSLLREGSEGPPVRVEHL
jgi:hypothetical protein